jgi:hypothetical protein
MYLTIFLVVGVITSIIGILLFYISKLLIEKGERDALQDVNEATVETQKDYLDVSSRVPSTAEQLIARMHSEQGM